MQVWITKYALTTGIFEATADKSSSDWTCVVFPTKLGEFTQYFHRKEWHKTEEAAKTQARKMRDAKLVAIEKQRKRLESLIF